MVEDERDLYVGKRFNSYTDVETWLEKYEDREGYEFSRQNSTTVESSRVKNLPEHLRFYEVQLGCVCRGTHVSKGKGIRNRKSKKTGCEAKIIIRAKKKKYLQVMEFNVNHNHESSHKQALPVDLAESVEASVRKEDKEKNESPDGDQRDLLIGTSESVEGPIEKGNVEETHSSGRDQLHLLFGTSENGVALMEKENPEQTSSSDRDQFDLLVDDNKAGNILEKMLSGNIFVGEELIELDKDCKSYLDRLPITEVEPSAAKGDTDESPPATSPDKQLLSSTEIENLASGLQKNTSDRGLPRKLEVTVNDLTKVRSADEDLSSVVIKPAKGKGRPRQPRPRAIGLPQNASAKAIVDAGKKKETKSSGAPVTFAITNAIESADTHNPILSEDRAQDTTEMAESGFNTGDSAPAKSPGEELVTSTNIEELPSSAEINKFSEKSAITQTKVMLDWLLPQKTVRLVLGDGYKVQCTDLNLLDVPESFMNESVKLDLLQPLFNRVAFKALRKAIEKKIEKDLWSCGTCKHNLIGRSVLCEGCLLWYHFKCVSLKRKPSAKTSWFCPECKK